MIKLPGVKKLIILLIILLPIIALAMYTAVSNRSATKKHAIKENTIANRSPSEISDEIASYIEAGDFETAFVRIDEALKDPNIPTSRGIPLLVLAAHFNSYDLAAVLLAKGADANIADSNTGETALIKAARLGNLDLMNLLLIANADPNAQSRRGVTVLTAAIQNGNPVLAEFLLSRGARAGSTQENMLNYAFQKKFIGVDAMLKTGVNPNFADKNGNTPLIIAASYGDILSAKALVTYKADVNAANNMGMTALLYAIQTRNAEMTDFLLEKGADVNKSNTSGESPLFWAAYFGNTKLVDTLLKLDADYNKVTKSNFTPLQIAQRNNHKETAKLIADFIAYKNIPRDEKGRPIIPKKQTASAAAAKKQAAPKTAAKAQANTKTQAPSTASMPGMPDLSSIPGMPSGAVPPGYNPASGVMSDDMEGEDHPSRKIGNTEIGRLRTSGLN